MWASLSSIFHSAPGIHNSWTFLCPNDVEGVGALKAFISFKILAYFTKPKSSSGAPAGQPILLDIHIFIYLMRLIVLDFEFLLFLPIVLKTLCLGYLNLFWRNLCFYSLRAPYTNQLVVYNWFLVCWFIYWTIDRGLPARNFQTPKNRHCKTGSIHTK